MTSWKQQINKHTVKVPAEVQGHGNGQLPASVLVDVFNGNGKRIGRLNRRAAAAWQAMVAAAKREGVILDATDTYRDLATQQRLWDTRYDHTDHGNGGRTCGGEHRFLKKGMATAACPATSNHGWGNAVDDKNQTAATGLSWLEAHAIEFGFEWELASEVWHLHYFAGDDVPAAVHDQGDTFMPALTDDEQRRMLGNIDRLAYASDHSVLPTLVAIAQKIDAGKVDPSAIAQAVIAGLDPAKIADAVAAALPADQAQRVADELAKRLAG